MQAIKSCAGKPFDHEDIIEKIMDGLDDDYQPVIDAINGRDIQISFDELHEKLINNELLLHQKISSSPLPASANQTNIKSTPKNYSNRPSQAPRNSSPQGIAASPHTYYRDGRPPLNHSLVATSGVMFKDTLSLNALISPTTTKYAATFSL